MCSMPGQPQLDCTADHLLLLQRVLLTSAPPETSRPGGSGMPAAPKLSARSLTPL